MPRGWQEALSGREHLLEPLCEDPFSIKGPRGSLGMELHGGYGKAAVPKPFVGPVVEINHRLFERIRKGRGIDGVPVVVRGHQDLVAYDIFHGLVPAAMTVGKFEGFCPARECEQLVAEAHAV